MPHCLTVLILASLIMPRAYAGPVGRDLDANLASINSSGDILLAGNKKILLSLDQGLSFVPFTGFMPESEEFTGGISERSLKGEIQAVICAGNKAFYIAGTLENLKTKEQVVLSSREHLICSMAASGQVTMYARESSTLFSNLASIPLNIKGRSAILRSSNKWISLLTEDGTVELRNADLSDPHSIKLPFTADVSTNMAVSEEMLVVTSSMGSYYTALDDVPNIQFKRLNIAPCTDQQRCDVTISKDGRISLFGYWGTWLGTAPLLQRFKTTFLSGKQGFPSFRLGGDLGQFVMLDGNEGDFGDLKDLDKVKYVFSVEKKLPSDEHSTRLSHHDLILRAPRWAEDIKRDEAFLYAQDANIVPKPVVIAAIDTGADLSHPFLKFHDALHYDFIRETSIPIDEFGHGTHVAGLLAGKTDDSPFAVAKNAKLLVFRALDRYGKSNSIDLARAIHQAVDAKVDIINCSWGGGNQTLAVKNAVQRALNAGIMIFASAGNDNLNTDTYPQVPGIIPGVLTVGALGTNDEKASFSNYGKNSVFLFAPGEKILSTVRVKNTHEPLGEMSGTSMASPIAASSAGWLLGLAKTIFPHESKYLRAARVRRALCQGAPPRLKDLSRCGSLNIQEATKALLQSQFME